MTDRPDPSKVPTAQVQPARKSLLERVSVVWLVPIVALLIALAVVWSSYRDQGPMIRISFESASGIKAGETQLRYRDVAVGLVESVKFSDDLEHVLVDVRVNEEVAPFIDDEAVFWVVKADVSAQGISGLDTVLSGNYIEGAWDNEPGPRLSSFDGLLNPPITRPDARGISIRLRTADGVAVAQGTPVLYRGIDVGRVTSVRLAEDGATVLSEIFIDAPNDRLVTSNTRFWDASGFDISVGPQGVDLNVGNLSSLLSGGVVFDSFVSGGDPVENGAVFQLFDEESDARNNVFNEEDTSRTVPLSAVFEGAIAGLKAGDPVEFGGVTVGRVTSLTGHVDPERFGDRSVRLLANLEIRPQKLGLEPDASDEAVYAFLGDQVEAGVRAQLVTASIFTGGIKVLLTDPGRATEEEPLDLEAKPYPLIPSVPADITDVSATAEGVFQRVNGLPIEDVFDGVIRLLDNANSLIASDAVQKVPEDVSALTGELRGLVTSDEVTALPAQLSETMAALKATSEEAKTTVAAINRMVVKLEEGDAATKITEALASASAVMADIEATTEGLPEVRAQLDALMAKANALPLEDLASESTALVEVVRGLVESDSVAALPDQLGKTMTRIETAVSDAGGIFDGLGEIVTKMNEQDAATKIVAAIEDISGVAEDLSGATESLPALTARAEALLAKAEGLPLEELTAQATDLMATADRLIGTEDARQIPASLNGALDQLNATLAEVREGGVVENANAALASASQAARALEEASATLPALSAQLRETLDTAEATLATAETTLKGYEANGPVTAEMRTAMRSVREAAQALESLARTIERKPNSLILGR